jgi:succinoglycan biosynthesis protein ExoA
LNEAENMDALLRQMREQVPGMVRQILVADGGSSDGTQDIVLRHAGEDGRVRLLHNTRRLQSAGFNLAAREAASEIDTLVRVDAHAQYPADYVAKLLSAQQESHAQSVVNRLDSVGVACFQRAVAATSNSRFGTGGAAHRLGAASGFIDHGHHALFERASFLALGGYDESFIANEDAEFDARLRAAGGRIWFTADATIRYFPRRTPSALARQYYRYGAGRARTRRKHREPLHKRQILPPLLLVGLIVCLLAAPLAPIFLLGPGLYFCGVIAATMALLARTRDRCVLASSIALPIMHLCWGAGFLTGTFDGMR